MIWVSRALAGVTVAVGPAALVYARSDLGPWTAWPQSDVLSVPFAFHAYAAFGYVVATGATRAEVSTLRAVIAAVGCLLIPFATFALSVPLLFALGENNSNLPAVIACGLLALPTAAFQVLMTRRRGAASILEFLSHPCVTSGAFLIGWVLPEATRDQIPDRMFQGWLMLLALAPFVALAITGATPVPRRRLVSACVVAAIPIYIAMTVSDIKDGRGAQAALWPARVWHDFTSISDHVARVHAVTAIRPGVPVRIGEHWYRFDRPGIPNAWPSNVRHPDRIVFLQLDIPADDLDLPEMRIAGDHVQLNIRTPTMPFGNSLPSPEELERGGTYVAIADRDLIVYVVAPRNRSIDRAKVRSKLRQFIRSARVEPTARGVQQ